MKLQNKNNYLNLIWFIALLPIILFRDYTPSNELRYLSIVDEALRNGSLFTFSHQGVPYADKPPFFFWLMMVGKLILGGHYMWYLSLLSFIPAVIILMVMNKWIRNECDQKDITVAQLLLMSCALFIGSAPIVRMDMLMTMFIVLALYTFFKIYSGASTKKDTYLFPVYVFLAVFSKGPVGLLMPLISTLVFLIFKKQIKSWKKYWGGKTLIILLVLFGVWFTGVYIEGGTDYLNNLVFHQTVGRAVDSFHHKAPFYFYGISIWYTIIPWSFLFVGLSVAGLYQKKIKTDIEWFFLIIIVSTFLMLSFFSSKLAIYLVPILPFLAYFSALQLRKYEWNKWIGLSLAIPSIIFILALPAIMFVTSNNSELSYLRLPLIYAGAGILTLTGIFSIVLIYRQKDIYRTIKALVLGLFLTLFVVGWSMKDINPQIGFADVCKEAKAISVKEKTFGYNTYKIKRSVSMDVFLGEKVQEITISELSKKLNTNELLIVERKTLDSDKELNAMIENKERYLSVNYYIVVLK
ncbi:MAG: glycosyltransferase family 39 protein [Bacteroidales bacterium]|nr:glycosyltransferase family 39 protein [Bacteroidales bacterium]